MCRKHCGKRRNCSLRAISPFPAVFSKDLYLRHVKNQDLFWNGVKCYSNIKFVFHEKKKDFLGKGEIAGYHHFLVSRNVFQSRQKPSFCGEGLTLNSADFKYWEKMQVFNMFSFSNNVFFRTFFLGKLKLGIVR